MSSSAMHRSMQAAEVVVTPLQAPLPTIEI